MIQLIRLDDGSLLNMDSVELLYVEGYGDHYEINARGKPIPAAPSPLYIVAVFDTEESAEQGFEQIIYQITGYKRIISCIDGDGFVIG